MITSVDCITLAYNVYDPTGQPEARAAGWRVAATSSQTNGFFAAAYEKEGQWVVAYRGTDDTADVSADLSMIPLLSDAELRAILPKLTRAYGLAGRADIAVVNFVLTRILSSRPINGLVGGAANQMPAGQTGAALDFFRQFTNPKPILATGHSLGGALAKAVAATYQIKGVAFNSPYLGGTSGISAVQGQNLININAYGDPLSTATEGSGNRSLAQHNRQVQLPQVNLAQPALAQREINTVVRAATNGARALTGNADSSDFYNLLTDVSSIASRAIASAQNPAGLSAQVTANYIGAMGAYLGAMAGYHHSSNSLLTAMSAIGGIHNANLV